MPSPLSKNQSILLVFFLESDRNLDPIRIMKGLFIFNMQAPEAWLPKDARYRFIPYSYGPYSREIERDLMLLSIQGYLQQSKAAGKSWNYYALSDKGQQRAKEALVTLPPAAVGYLHRVREFVSGLTFRKLLDVIYAKYPEYAVNSVFKN